MANQLIHTPEGVRDIYGNECRKKLAVQDKILHVLKLYGYEHIETPSFEFFDIFNAERGSVSSREMFKFFDRDNNTLVLRPDMTPAIARCVAKYFMDEEMALRLCYLERTFTNNSNYQGRLKETTQMGAEMIGDDTCEADAEMIAMVIDSLKASGLQEFQVELGEVEFFKGLAEEAGMDEEVQEALRELIENKNYFGVEELVNAQNISEELKLGFLKLPELFGSLENIQTARTLTKNPCALKALDRLERIYTILDSYHMAEYVSFDLGMLSHYQYYTGLIFKAYTYGTGDYVVNGGRYDKLLVQYGKDSPAIGFAVVIDRLLMALERQQIETEVSPVNTMILYENTAWQAAVRLGISLRAGNTPVQMMKKKENTALSDYTVQAKKRNIQKILYLADEGDKIQIVSTEQETIREIPFGEYGKEE